MALALPPLVPKVDAILVLDGDGDRLAGKYYGDYFSSSSSSSGGGGNSNSSALQTRELRSSFEKQLQQKIAGMTARPDAAEVVTVMGRTAVFCGGPSAGGAGAGGANNALPPTTSGGGGDVRVVHVGPPGESELVLAHLCEGMYNALSQLMGGSTDRTMVLDNLELVFLLIDEHCDGGIILETDAHKLAAAVLLRDGEDAAAMMGGGSGGAGGGGPGDGMPAGAGGGGGMSSGDMTIAQALRQARQQFLAGLTTSSRDGN